MNTQVGILIEGTERATPALDAVIRKDDELAKSTQRLTSAFEYQSHAAERAAKWAQQDAEAIAKQAAWQQKLAAEASKAAAAQEKATAAAGANSAANRKTSESIEDLVQALGLKTGALGRIVGAFGLTGTAIGAFTLLAGGATTALLLGAHAIADYQRELDAVAQTTGLTTGQLAGLRLAAADSGRSFEQVRPALDYFVRTIGEAAEGNAEAVDSFDDLGVKINDFSGHVRPVGDILQEVQDKLRGIEDPAQRARLAAELFGKGGAASMTALLAPLEEGEARAKKFGLALGEAEQIARDADAAFNGLAARVKGVMNAFGLFGAVALLPFIKGMTDAIDVANALAASLVGPGPEMVGASPKYVSRLPRGETITPQFGTGGDFFRDSSVVKEHQKAQEAAREAAEKAAKALAAQVAEIEKAIAVGEIQTEDAIKRLQALGSEKIVWEAITKEIERQNVLLKSRPGIGNMPGPPVPPGFQSPNALEGIKPTGGGMPERQPFSQFFGEASAAFDKLALSVKLAGAAADAEAEAEAKRKAEEDAIFGAIANTLSSSFSRFIISAVTGVQTLSEAFQSLVSGIAQSMLEIGVQTGVKALFGLPFQQGGIIRAQSGLVMSGVRGRDTVLAAVGRGEGVLDHTMMDELKAGIREMRSRDTRMGSGRAVVVNLQFGEGSLRIDSGMSDPMFVRAFAAKLIPEIGRAVRYGMA